MWARRARSLAVALILGGLPPVVLAVGAPPALAATITVTSPADAGPGTLREAVAIATPGDTITFSSALNGVPIQLTGPEILINKNLTIRGNGDDFTIIQRTGGTGRIFHNAAPADNVVIDSVTIAGGNTDPGAGIQNESVVTMTLTRSTVSGNFSSSEGGGIRNLGPATIRNSRILSNVAANAGGISHTANTMTIVDTLVHANTATNDTGLTFGGGIHASSPLNLQNTDVVSNTAFQGRPEGVARGGGIDMVFFLNYHVTDSSIRDNLARGPTHPGSSSHGGGLNLENGAIVVLDRVEISDNRLLGGRHFQAGAGIFSRNQVNLSVTNSTLANNDAQAGVGGGIAVAVSPNPSTASFQSSTLANNTADRGLNMFSEGGGNTVTVNDTINANTNDVPGNICSGPIFGAVTNLVFGPHPTCPGLLGNPNLGPLAFNGGPTRTMALGPGSAATNNGSGSCPLVDQRNFPRNVGPCDIGATELGSSLNDLTAPSCAMSALRADNPKQMDVTVSDDSSGVSTITPTLQQNGVVNVPYFQRGTRNQVIVTATKVDQGQATRWAFDATDLVGNKQVCT